MIESRVILQKVMLYTTEYLVLHELVYCTTVNLMLHDITRPNCVLYEQIIIGTIHQFFIICMHQNDYKFIFEYVMRDPQLINLFFQYKTLNFLFFPKY